LCGSVHRDGLLSRGRWSSPWLGGRETESETEHGRPQSRARETSGAGQSLEGTRDETPDADLNYGLKIKYLQRAT
jgi:hypothetical protein